MTETPTLGGWLASLLDGLQSKKHRALVVLSGEQEWCRSMALDMLSSPSFSRMLWVGDAETTEIKSIAAKSMHQVLGLEYDAVVYDAYKGFDADAFAAVSGTIRGGGIYVLITPPFELWATFSDPVYARLFSSSQAVASAFIPRFVRMLKKHLGVYCIAQEQQPCLPRLSGDNKQSELLVSEYPSTKIFSEAQAEAVVAVVNVVTGHRRRPLVLTSDRGRGKSATLGMAAAQLLKQGVQRVVVTGPRLDALASLFKHAHQELPGSRLNKGVLSYEERTIEYFAPDMLVAQEPRADCLMVDEAAALPAVMLERLLRRYSRLVFSTTVHGYEGSGRGFALRFFNTLDQTTPNWKQCVLTRAFRWSENDPLEDFIFHALLLKNDIAPPVSQDEFELSECRVDSISGVELANNEEKLREIFGLLVLAHYRTRPNDLRQLLDNPDMRVFVISSQCCVLGVALVVNEGVLDHLAQQAVYRGERRLRGHLLAQTLLAHLGLQEVGAIKFSRIMRIAVHPALHGLGLGRRLIEALVSQLRRSGCDMLGTSFGANENMLAFWRKVGFDLVRMGLTREQSTGCHSAVMLRVLSERSDEYHDRAKKRFFLSWPYLLRGPLADLDAGLVVSVTSFMADGALVALDDAEWYEVDGFAHGHRGYELSIVVLDKLTWQVLAKGDVSAVMSERLRDLWIAKVVQNKAWTEIIQHQGYTGMQQAVAALRLVFQRIIACYR